MPKRKRGKVLTPAKEKKMLAEHRKEMKRHNEALLRIHGHKGNMGD